MYSCVPQKKSVYPKSLFFPLMKKTTSNRRFEVRGMFSRLTFEDAGNVSDQLAFKVAALSFKLLMWFRSHVRGGE